MLKKIKRKSTGKDKMKNKIYLKLKNYFIYYFKFVLFI